MAACRPRLKFILVALASLGCWSHGILFGQDTLQIHYSMGPHADSIDAVIHLQWEGTMVDTGWSAASRQTPPTAWSECPLGRAQIDGNWPAHGDSLFLHLHADRLGLMMIIGTDTLQQPWLTRNTGCFPATPDREFNPWLETGLRIPFESKRHQVALDWVLGHCLTTQNLGQLMGTFDDESRRLSLVQHARLVDPERVAELSERFVSSRYRAACSDWAAQRD